MRAKDIRDTYRREGAATDREADQTTAEARTDPETARAFLKTIFALSTEDREFAMLLHLFLEGALMRLIEERADSDDAFALSCSNLIADLMAAMKPGRAPRGRGKPSKSA